MKSLIEMSNVEKAKLLATLFPEHLQPMTDAIQAGCQYIFNNQDTIKEEWNNALVTASFWFDVARDVASVLQTFRHHIGKSRISFSEQLFYGYRAMVSTEYILRYAQAIEGNNRFRLAVQLLFEPDNFLPVHQHN